MNSPTQDQRGPLHVTVYCDDGHRRTTVENYVRVPATEHGPARWTQRLINGNRRNSPGTAVLIDGVPAPEVPQEKVMAIARGEVQAEQYTRFKLVCRKCHPRNELVVRDDRLMEYLDPLADRGVSEVSLRGLAGIVSGN